MNPPVSSEGMTEQEIAERLSIEEGRVVKTSEIYMLECRALRKLRQALSDRGIGYDDLQPVQR